MKRKTKTGILINLKSLPREKREGMRRKIFEKFGAGIKSHAAAAQLRLNPSCVHRLYERFALEGEKAVREKKRGPAAHPAAKLDAGQKEALARAITHGSPKQLVFDFALWSSKAVVEFVRRKFGKTICRRTARRILGQMGFTYQCPVRQAREQNPEAVRTWLEETYPAIKREAQETGARIYWADESAVMVLATKARGYSPRGVSPVLKTTANRSVRCNYIAAVDSRGEMFFQTFEGAMNADLFKGFVLALLEENGGPLVLIVDNLKVHHARCLQEWFREMERTRGFRIRYLPSHAPEYNPEEYLNRNIKARTAEQALPASKEAAVRQTTANLRKQREDKAAIRALFKNEKVKYAAQ